MRSKPPPPPTVEDEEISLRREHGSVVSGPSEEDAPSKGDVDQNPVIMEVHEYNPERRFVILTGSSSASEGGEPERRTEKPSRTARDEKVPRDVSPEARSSRNYDSNFRPGTSDSYTESRNSRKRDPSMRSETRDAYGDQKTSRRNDSSLRPEIGTTRGKSRSPLEKRRSHQELPRIETDLREDQLPEKYRPRPSASTSRADYASARPTKSNVDLSFAPEVIKHSPIGREQVYHGYGQPQSTHKSPTRQTYSSQPDDRRYDGQNRGSSTAPASKRSIVEAEKPVRPLSKERVGESQYRGDYAPQRAGKTDNPAPGRSEREEPGRPSTYQPRDSTLRREDRREDRRDDHRDDRRDNRRDDRGEDSRSGDDHPKGPRELHPRRGKSVVVQDDRDSLPRLDKVTDAPGGPRRIPRGPTMSIPVPIPSSFPDSATPNPRSSATFPVTKDEQARSERPKSQLPYPVDDDLSIDPFDTRAAEWPSKPRYETEPAVMMPDMPFPIAIGPETPLEARVSASPINANVPAPTGSWQPPSFNPERDAVRLDKPMGSVRRHSEHIDAGVVTKFPECCRKHPVAGRVDWLTLPRTDFNICPGCYDAVFAKTEHRKPFQPMLRPTDKAISCDFGVGPWYRIAWLLTLKNNLPDLRLFHDVANAISATQNSPCPGDRSTTRTWLTLWNPHTRQPIYDFTVCPQCVKVVQTLLPNLAGIFIPLDSRSEPTRGICAMRFKPKRKRFVMYFDALEITSDQARLEQEEPHLMGLAMEVERMAAVSECQEDTPIANGYWHTMQFLPQFSACGECYDEVVRPLIKDNNVIARNFFKQPEKIPLATCQLYSLRMREIFQKACRWNDAKYLEAKVLERMDIEATIHDKLAQLERSGDDEEWVEEQVDKLIQEWKRWE